MFVVSLIDINTMLCPMKVNSNTIELTVHTSCYCILDLHCVTGINGLLFEYHLHTSPKTSPIFKHFYYLKAGHQHVKFLDISFIWVSQCMSPVSLVFHTIVM